MKEPLKIISSPAIVRKMVDFLYEEECTGETTARNTAEIYPDFLGLTKEIIFLVDLKKSEQKRKIWENDLKRKWATIKYCSIEEFLKWINKSIEKIFIDKKTPAKIMIFFNNLKEIDLKISKSLIDEEEIKNIFHQKKVENNNQTNNILQHQIDLMKINQEQLDECTRAVLIAEMAAVCSYHKIREGALLKEIELEMQHYVDSKCAILKKTKMHCQAESFCIDGGTLKKIHHQTPISDHQAICLNIFCQSQDIFLEKKRILSYGVSVDKIFAKNYENARESYLEVRKNLWQNKKQGFALKKFLEIIEKVGEKYADAQAKFFFSEKFNLKLLPKVLQKIKRKEILSIFFPAPIEIFCLHTIVHFDEKNHAKSIVSIDQDDLELLRFF